MHEPGTLTVDASIVDQMIAGREEIIASLKRENDLLELAAQSGDKAYAKLLEAFDTQSAENAHLRQELARVALRMQTRTATF